MLTYREIVEIVAHQNKFVLNELKELEIQENIIDLITSIVDAYGRAIIERCKEVVEETEE